MSRISYVAGLLGVLLVGEAVAQVRVEVPREAVQLIRGESGGHGGVIIETVMPGLAGKQELLAALLWLEVTAARPYNERGEDGPVCLAAAPLAGEGTEVLGACGLGVPVAVGQKRTMCFDITELVRGEIQLGRRMCGLGIVPCPGEETTGTFSVSGEAPVAGWIEYSFYDKAKIDRMLRE